MRTDFHNQLVEWRQYLHTVPETGFDLSITPDFVAARLQEMGIEVHRNIGKTGLVGIIRKGNGGRTIGLRADMDALPIKEITGLPYVSTHAGKMHACGHDGHTSTLLGAAKLLKEEYEFNGTVILIFQPDEENGKGARAMIADGLFDRFPMDEIYGQHNMPGMPVGKFGTRAGGVMGSEDNFIIRIKGRGGHAARPHMGRDPLVTAAQIITALQTIVSRNLDPCESAVVSCTEIHTDGVRNTIPSNVEIKGDTRSYSPAVQELLMTRMRAIVTSICEMNDSEGELIYTHEFSPTVNWEEQKDYAVAAAQKVFGEENVDGNIPPMMVSEDFGAFIENVPGCFVFIGNGVEEQGKGFLPLHNAGYDFNDDILETGARYFAEIASSRLK
ncbi:MULTISPECIES: M20 aminoacylase family protein [unclassified Tatumella]|uniref:M20 aminoacylase family protein n=1 Tax=unclassified Tatumella TaxID=2649542 RepID=UPI001BAE596C|nr:MULTISPECIES: M20 aminoacylase family protein [unclassified Tatumella]MBS0878168.1 amidohydrolase [Tatumella sp. JGM82]MBS0892287.1 amidohydrolase [Tatumella sp. JGM94]MBS0902881.1 amidohydrolase [Tatumella sp. JGM100]